MRPSPARAPGTESEFCPSCRRGTETRQGRAGTHVSCALAPSALPAFGLSAEPLAGATLSAAPPHPTPMPVLSEAGGPFETCAVGPPKDQEKKQQQCGKFAHNLTKAWPRRLCHFCWALTLELSGVAGNSQCPFTYEESAALSPSSR